MSSKSPAKSLRTCLATVTTDSFIPGTLVMLYSFLKHNRWFDGEIVVFIDELKPINREYLCSLYERIRFVRAGQDLIDRVNELTTALPEYRGKLMSFHTIESFALKGYDKVFYLDGDLLFCDSIGELVDLPHPLIVAGDAFNYNNRAHEWYVRPEPESGRQDLVSFENTFNAGLMIIDGSFLTDQNYNDLLNLIDSRIYAANETNLTDQIILNMYFSGRQHIVSAKYNYVIAHTAAIREKEGLTPAGSKVIHFSGPIKPWLPEQAMRSSQHNPVLIKPFGIWFENYIECLEEMYVHTNRPNG